MPRYNPYRTYIMNTIIIGCGATMENGFGGPVKCERDQFDKSGCYPHALHTHHNCTTVDINPACSPSIVLNFATPDRSELVRKIGNEKFDLIVLEFLPNRFYHTPEYCSDIITNCSYILTATGKVFIPFLRNVNAVLPKTIFSFFGYKLIHESTDYSLIYPIVSAIAGKYADEYMMTYKYHTSLCASDNTPAHFFVFKR